MLSRVARRNGVFVRFQSSAVFPSVSEVRNDELVGHGSYTSKSYFVERSRVGNLPVYSDYRGGGNKVVTEIRRIRGNAVQLKKDLQAVLPHIPEKDWRVISQSNKIEIKGNYISELKSVLSEIF